MAAYHSYLKEHLSGEFYPLIGIPDYVQCILQETISFPKLIRPEKPEKPVLHLPPPPKPPVQGKFSRFLGFDSSYNSSIVDYKLALYKYHNSFSHEKSVHAGAIEIYNKQLARYQDEDARYKRNCELQRRLQEPLPIFANDIETRAQLVAMYLDIIPRPMSWSKHSQFLLSSKGISEPFFKKQLAEKYGASAVSEAHGISTYDYAIYEGSYRLPDFILQIPNTNLVIAIEIDEPYSSDFFEPIHYIDRNNRNEDDGWPTYTQEDQDNTLKKCGWVVIRFTEKQVVESPAKCLDLIDNLSNWLLQKSDWNQLAYCINKIEVQKRWTKSEAYGLISNEFRESYLPSDLKKILLARNALDNSSREDELPF